MDDFAFYNAGGDAPRGMRRAIVPMRRVLRRILRPIFLRQAELFLNLSARLDDADSRIADLHRRHDLTSDQMQETIAIGWDHVAMARRLAALEDRIEALQTRSDSPHPKAGPRGLIFADADVARPRSEAC